VAERQFALVKENIIKMNTCHECLTEKGALSECNLKLKLLFNIFLENDPNPHQTFMNSSFAQAPSLHQVSLNYSGWFFPNLANK